jgi:hypothetical protein
MYIISVINKINNFTNDKRVFVDAVTILNCNFSISHQDRQDDAKNSNVGAIKNSILVPGYLQTCSSSFCIYIVEKYLYFYFISGYFSQKNDNQRVIPPATPPAKRFELVQ